MKDHEAWIMYDGAELKINLTRHIFGTVQKSSLGVEGFRRGTGVTICWASRFCQNLKGITNHHQIHIWDCSEVIPGGGGF